MKAKSYQKKEVVDMEEEIKEKPEEKAEGFRVTEEEIEIALKKILAGWEW